MRPNAVSPDVVSFHAGRRLLTMAGLPVLFLFSSPAFAATINVPADQPTIQAGIDAALNGDTVVVAPGTYVENIDFLGKDLILTSVDPNDPNVVATTIIDGSQPADPEKASVVTFENGETAAATLTGFTITGGEGTRIDFALLSTFRVSLNRDDLFGDAPYGIALDVDSGKMYWTDISNRSINRANLDGTNIELLVSGLQSPIRIALDLTAGKMYWADNKAGNIQRSNLDGTEIETIHTGIRPYDLAILAQPAKLYWIDLQTWSIRRSNLDGTNIEDVLGNAQAASKIEVDSSAGKIYWVEGITAIKRADLDGSNEEVILEDFVFVDRRVNDLYLDASNEKIYWSEGYGNGKIRRANLDGSSVELISAAPRTAEGIAVDSLGGKVYWADSWFDVRRILRVNLDGTNFERLVEGLPIAGGGIFCSGGSSPTIIRNSIVANEAEWGGGLFAARGSLPAITNNRLEQNSAQSWGGAIYVEYPFEIDAPPVLAPLVTNNDIRKNASLATVAVAGSSAILTGNTITDNIGTGLLVTNSIFRGITLTQIGPPYAVFPTVENNTIAQNAESEGLGGGGISVTNVAHTSIRRNTIVFNKAKRDGGGISIPLITPPSLLTVTNNAILYNKVSRGWGGGFYGGGFGGHVIQGNTIAHNQAPEGGAIFGYQGAIESAINYPGLTIIDNFMLNNVADVGGALSLRGPTLPLGPQGHILVQNVILRNRAMTDAAIHAEKTNVLLGNVIADNHADFGPAGVLSRIIPNSALYAGNTIVGNTSGDPAAVNGFDNNCELSFPDGDVFANNLLHANTNDITPGCPDGGEPTYSNISDGTYVPGVFGSNESVPAPGFVDPANGDYHLAAGSPLIDAGDPAYVAHTIDPSGRNDLPPDLPTFLETDADGNPRIANGRVDIGAYEFDPTAARPSPDPMDFATAKVVADAGQLKIILTAKAATVPTDGSATVEYLFESPTGAKKGPASGWQGSPTFLATGLEVGHWYTYRVKARNASRPDQETHVSPIRAFFVTAPGDLDRDLDVDIFDFLAFSNCYNGAGAAPTAACESPFADLDDDGDVDGDDFLTLGACFNGATNPPKCP